LIYLDIRPGEKKNEAGDCFASLAMTAICDLKNADMVDCMHCKEWQHMAYQDKRMTALRTVLSLNKTAAPGSGAAVVI